jgi:alkylation response protein AidB-like acyl-CoA dehydrogenase
MTYRVDLRDIEFQLFEWLPMEDVLRTERFADWDEESLRMGLGEALKIAQKELDPANESGDREGSHWQDGVVTVPDSFLSAYRMLAEGGWVGAVNNPEFGGLGMPAVVGAAANEFFDGANLGLALSLLLTRGAGELIEHFGDDELRGLFCEKLYTGEWTGTMCLTESQAGSDVGASTTRAVEQSDGRYLISGEKIFITYGDHNMTENVVHAVLARLPDAAAGAKGLSLFVVPKILVNADGSLGDANDVQCASIEHKLGIHGSPTCSMLFGAEDSCVGYLIGEENAGLKLMFQMMNAARLEVGLQGMAVAGAAHQAALTFARERIQGRHWAKLTDKDAPLVAIVEHPDVRRMLWTSNAYVQAMRALLLKTYYFVDMAATTEGDEQAKYQGLVDFMTPLCKAWASDWGVRVTDWCLQVFGGYGYTTDYPAEQYLRDVRITPIYEGTNGIQALDLVMRKFRARGGAALEEILAHSESVAQRLKEHSQLSDAAAQLADAVGEVRSLLAQIPTRSDAFLSLTLNAVPILDMLGHTVAGGLLLEQGSVAHEKLYSILAEKGVQKEDAGAWGELLESDPDAAFYHNKVCSAVHFAHRCLPLVKGLGVAVQAGETAAIDAVM